MQRYSNIPIQSRYDGKRVYTSVVYPPMYPAVTDMLVVSNDGDFLDTLAYKYYGDPTLFWIIANANGLGKGRFSVPPGLTLRIPTNISDIINQYNKLNS